MTVASTPTALNLAMAEDLAMRTQEFAPAVRPSCRLPAPLARVFLRVQMAVLAMSSPPRAPVLLYFSVNPASWTRPSD